MKNVEFAMIILVNVDGSLRHFVVGKFGMNTNIDAQVFSVLRPILEKFSDPPVCLPPNIRFRAFWYGCETWIENTAAQIEPSRAGNLLICVDSRACDGKSARDIQAEIDWRASFTDTVRALIPVPAIQPPPRNEPVQHVFNTYVTGNVQNLASGSTGVTQTATCTEGFAAETFAKLFEALAHARLPGPISAAATTSAHEMRAALGTPSFAAKYQAFMSVLADHIAVLGPVVAPFLPAIAAIAA